MLKVFKMMTWLFLVLFGVFLAIGLYLFFNQGRMVFIPMKELAITPDELNLVFEDVLIEVVPEQKIHAWYFPSLAGKKTVLFCHGNAGNISHRLETVQFLTSFNVNVLLFDYRGYGRSDGKPSEAGVYEDALAAFNWLVREKNIANSDIILFGRSLGGAVAVETALKVPCGGVIVESSFTSVAELGQKMFPFFPVRYLLRYKFDSAAKIGLLSCPVLITHSPDDDIIPFEMGRKLYNLAPEPKYFIELCGSHNDREYLNSISYINGIRKFLFSETGN
ncbi:MAG: alpha/beta hydrolase [candidate division Zixibacteria bacterium]|nr:alpha/beta hydrolase [candidate division Zixibacteria bacterium]